MAINILRIKVQNIKGIVRVHLKTENSWNNHNGK